MGVNRGRMTGAAHCFPAGEPLAELSAITRDRPVDGGLAEPRGSSGGIQVSGLAFERR